MGSSYSTPPPPTFEAWARVCVEDSLVPAHPTRTATYGTDPPPRNADLLHVPPPHFAALSGRKVCYRVPGVGYGKAVAKYESRILLQMFWPAEPEFASVERATATVYPREHCVVAVDVPDAWVRPGGLPWATPLPRETRVTFYSGDVRTLHNCTPGTQRVINYCYAARFAA